MYSLPKFLESPYVVLDIAGTCFLKHKCVKLKSYLGVYYSYSKEETINFSAYTEKVL